MNYLIARDRNLSIWTRVNSSKTRGEVVGAVVFWGGQTTTGGEFVSRLTAKTYYFETENASVTAEPKVGPKDLPKYILYQPLAAVSRSTESFFFLQCSARGAKTKPLFPTQPIDDAPLAALRP